MDKNDIFVFPQCVSCRHYQGRQAGRRLCKAYPKGLPDALWHDDADHRLPYPGDNGIRWQPKHPNDLHPREIVKQKLAAMKREQATRATP